MLNERRNVYNIGGGDACRLTSFQFTYKVYRMMGLDFREMEDPNWYATRNFHGQWYYDSDKLETYLNFRSEDVDDVLARIRNHATCLEVQFITARECTSTQDHARASWGLW